MRWADMDAFGIVNNVVFARYLEQARVDLLFAATDPAAVALQEGIVVARLEIDYRRPLTWRPEGVDVGLSVAEVGGASFTLAYDIRDAETVFATARTVLVAYDFAANRPRRLTAEQRRYLARYTTD